MNINYVIKVMSSCETKDQVVVTMEWLDRLGVDMNNIANTICLGGKSDLIKLFDFIDPTYTELPPAYTVINLIKTGKRNLESVHLVAEEIFKKSIKDLKDILA